MRRPPPPTLLPTFSVFSALRNRDSAATARATPRNGNGDAGEAHKHTSHVQRDSNLLIYNRHSLRVHCTQQSPHTATDKQGRAHSARALLLESGNSSAATGASLARCGRRLHGLSRSVRPAKGQCPTLPPLRPAPCSLRGSSVYYYPLARQGPAACSRCAVCCVCCVLCVLSVTAAERARPTTPAREATRAPAAACMLCSAHAVERCTCSAQCTCSA